MLLSWHSHSCVLIQTNTGKKIIIDPFISDNDLSDLDPETLQVDYIILTHAHNDHFGDTIEIAKNNDATVIAMVELADFLEKQGLKTHGMNIGGSYKFDFGKIKFTHAQHSSSLNWEGKNIPLGLAAGLLLEIDNVKVYHAGDTALFSDMSLFAPVDLALLPIGDNFTMGIKDAIQAAKLVEAKTAIPIHYNTFPIIKQNPERFVSGLKDTKGIIPEIGEVLKI